MRRIKTTASTATVSNKMTRSLLLLLSLLLLGISQYCHAFVPRQYYNHHQPSSPLFAVAKTGGKVLQTVDEFNDTINNASKPVLVFFTAPWCGPCRLTVPVVKDVSKQFASEITIVEVCTDDLPQVAADSNVVSIPTIQLYAQGKLVDTIVGCVAQSVLANCVQKTLEEDVLVKRDE